MTLQQVTPSPDEEIEWMPVEDHIRILAERLAEKDATIEHLNAVIAKLEAWGNGLQVKLASLSQELFRLKNLYPDMSNIFKGLAKWSPDSFKNAIMLIDFLWAQYQSVWLMYRRAHEKRKRPWWHLVFYFFFGAITFGVTVEAFNKPEVISAAAPYLALIAVVGLIVFIVLRRRSEARATKPQ